MRHTIYKEEYEQEIHKAEYKTSKRQYDYLNLNTSTDWRGCRETLMVAYSQNTFSDASPADELI